LAGWGAFKPVILHAVGLRPVNAIRIASFHRCEGTVLAAKSFAICLEWRHAMTYFPASLFVETERWHRRPPTGMELATVLGRYFETDIYIHELARLSGRSSTAIDWHLRQESVVPATVLAAALLFRQAGAAGLSATARN
jgi:hypothetical protein